MPVIHIEGRPYEVAAGQNLLQAALSLGFRLPYFCWHPALGSVGACRQCAVKLFQDEHDPRGRIVMACMTPAVDGARISIEDPEAAAFRAAVVEWLMTNHPHDCPVCDEGGECHLQDMTVMTGHVYRRHRFPKRTFRNQDLGPLIHHEMNRCIQCFRCVRFYRDYAGGDDLVPLGSRNETYFGRAHDGPLESPFSGNLVEVCPTGVFTDQRLRGHYTRKWDLQTAPSICVHCGLGCNTIAGERYGELRRVLNRYHGEVNGYFLCDRGRYGYEFVNGPRRIGPGGAARGAPAVTAVTAVTAVGAVGASAELERARELTANRERIGVGSPRASLEANFALRELVGAENFYNGLGPAENAALATVLRVLRSGLRAASLREAQRADAILILGEDVMQTAPRLALALRQALVPGAARQVAAERLRAPAWDAGSVQIAGGDARRPFFVAAPCAVGLPEAPDAQIATGAEGIADIAAAILRALEATPPPSGLRSGDEGAATPSGRGPGSAPDGDRGARASFVRAAASALAAAERPLIVCGASLGDPAPILAAARVARALAAKAAGTRIALVVPECNSLGAALLAEQGLGELLARLDRVGASREPNAPGESDRPALIVLENDLERRLGASGLARLRAGAGPLLAIEHTETATTRAADVVLPAATFAESSGTLINHEGRAQHFYAVFPPPEGIRSGWRWASDLADPGGDAGPVTLARWRAALAAAYPEWGARAMPPADSGVSGPVAQGEPLGAMAGLGLAVPRQSQRATGRTAVTANIAVSEPRPPEDPDTPLAHSMEGFPGRPPGELIARYWAPGWNSVQALTRFQEEIAGPLRGGDPGARLFDPPAVEGSAAPAAAGKDDLLSAAERSGFLPAAERSGFLPAAERDGFLPAAAEGSSAGGLYAVAPLAHVFGTEELSARAPGVAALAPRPYVALHAGEAARLGAGPGDLLEVAAGAEGAAGAAGASVALPLVVRADLPAGTAGLPLGLPQVALLGVPRWVRIVRAEGPR